jgi:hypothetical protein
MAGLTRFERVITKQRLLTVMAVFFLACSLFSCAALSTPALVSQIGASALSSAPTSPFQVFQSEGWKIWENELLTYGETGDGLTVEELKVLVEGVVFNRDLSYAVCQIKWWSGHIKAAFMTGSLQFSPDRHPERQFHGARSPLYLWLAP